MHDDDTRTTAVPRLVVTEDNAFFFAAARRGRLEVQQCGACGRLRHPPAPVCAHCRSFDWGTFACSRRCTLHSWTVVHHPTDPAFDCPVVVGLVDLAEGPRLVADIVGVDPEELVVGMALEVGFGEHAHGEILPRLHRPGAAT